MNVPETSELPGVPAAYFVPVDPDNDAVFYEPARIVTHIDDAAVAAVGQLFHERLPEHGVLLDLMSSAYSHLPRHFTPGRVVGLGMNEAELRANPQLDEWVIHDLNHDPALPFADETFDGAMCTVSVQYLRRPVSVFRDLARVLKAGAPVVIVFSNRCFPTKAVPIWSATSDQQHFELISAYLAHAGGFTDLDWVDASPYPGRTDPVYAVIARRVSEDVGEGG